MVVNKSGELVIALHVPDMSNVEKNLIHLGKRQRGKLDIMADILEVCAQESTLYTHIMYKSNMSQPQLKEYLQRLISAGLLTARDGKYIATDEGLRFLTAIRYAQRMLNTQR